MVNSTQPGKQYAKILKGIGGLYTVLLENGSEMNAKPRGILRKSGLAPYPGDDVLLTYSGDPEAPYRIDEILPRKNSIIKPAVANIDALLIAVSAADPAPDYFFVEKMIILSIRSGIHPVICVTKSDLDRVAADTIQEIYCSAGFDVFRTGFDDFDDHDGLLSFTRNMTISFAGLSGTGKSTLFNRLTETSLMDTGGLSEKNKKGRHTTRHSELIRFNGGFIADTPGFSALEITELGVTGEHIIKAYPELEAVAGKCRFAGCRHMGEKGCASDHSGISRDRLERYRYFRKAADMVPEHIIRQKSKGV